MLPKIIFFTAVIAATIGVILLALISPTSDKKKKKNPHPAAPSWLALSLYIQKPHPPTPPYAAHATKTTTGSDGALIFCHTLTGGPTNTSTVVGEAQGFIIPIDHFAHSSLNIIYLTLQTPGLYGSLSVQAKNMRNQEREELAVVGGTGSFAFARGLAVFLQTQGGDALYHVKLHLRFPNRLETIPAG